MRDAFVSALMAEAEANPDLWLLTGDLGYSVLEPFAEKYPSRYVNAGIAEQNMTGVAAGLALSGKTVVTYSIANFPTLRCLEQLRNDVCYHGLNVKIVAVGGGMAYSSLGYTHHAVEDLAIMRALPGMSVAAPADPSEVTAVTSSTLSRSGPGYIRLGKNGEPLRHPSVPALAVGDALLVRAGHDVTIASTGTVLGIALRAAESLAAAGVSAAVVSMPWVSPVSEQACDLLCECGPLVTVEEHSCGGLFSACAEALSDRGTFVKMRSIRLAGQPMSVAGTHDYLRTEAGLTAEAVADACLSLVRFSGRKAA